MKGSKALLLTTKGRRSGDPRTSPLIYGRHGDDYLVVASKGGAPESPAWYFNLEAEPEVEVQVKGDRFKARARTATSDERPELWAVMVGEWPDYDNYQRKTDREIPIVVLERQ
jgi:deazaflavin-dependent oxidoreductase (nitroreductase family)